MTVTEVNRACSIPHVTPTTSSSGVLRNFRRSTPGWRLVVSRAAAARPGRTTLARPGGTPGSRAGGGRAGRADSRGSAHCESRGFDRECVGRFHLAVARASRRRAAGRLRFPDSSWSCDCAPSPEEPVPVPQLLAVRPPCPTSATRVSVKLEAERRRRSVSLGQPRCSRATLIDVSEPRGSFVLQPGRWPGGALLSAGNRRDGAPCLAMLHSLAASASPRGDLVGCMALVNRKLAVPSPPRCGSSLSGSATVAVTSGTGQPGADDRQGTGTTSGRVIWGSRRSSSSACREGADFYLCGPTRLSSADLRARPRGWGVSPRIRIHSEIFSGGPSLTPGVVGAKARMPQPPGGRSRERVPLVSFARSGLPPFGWRPSARTRAILELAEGPLRRARALVVCRTGVWPTTARAD
jgi:hypothetical protein